MVSDFKSDSQRKGFFGSRVTVRSAFEPRMIKRAGIEKAPVGIQNQPKLTPSMKKFLATKIRKNLREGKPPKRAVAIAFSQARKKFGDVKALKQTGNPNGNPNGFDKRTRNLIFLIFGTAVALSLLRQIRQ